MVKVKELDERYVGKLESYLKMDSISNFYPLYDLYDEESRRKTSWYVGLRDDDICGFLLIYRGCSTPPASIFVNGDRETVSSLLEFVSEDKAVFHVDPQFSSIVKGKFPITGEYTTEILYIKKGEEKTHIKHDVELLSENHVFDVVKLLRERTSTLGGITGEIVEKAREELRKSRVYGVFADSRLVSMCMLESLPSCKSEVCWLSRVFTSLNYRNRGFATSVVSKAVEEAFKADSVKYVGLGVRSDNIPAKHVYEKIGFKKYKDRCWLSLNIEIAP